MWSPFNHNRSECTCTRHEAQREREREAKGQTREIIVSLYYDSSSLTLRSVKVLNRAFCIIMPLSIVSLSLPPPHSSFFTASVHAWLRVQPALFSEETEETCATPCALSRGNNNCLRAYIYKMACPCPCKAALTPPRDSSLFQERAALANTPWEDSHRGTEIRDGPSGSPWLILSAD